MSAARRAGRIAASISTPRGRIEEPQQRGHGRRDGHRWRSPQCAAPLSGSPLTVNQRLLTVWVTGPQGPPHPGGEPNTSVRKPPIQDAGGTVPWSSGRSWQGDAVACDHGSPKPTAPGVMLPVVKSRR